MEFIALTLGLLAVGFLILIGLARAFQGHGVAELLDWKPTRSYETEVQLELDDVQQMIDAQNELRRKRGAKEITEEDVQRQAREDQAMRMRGRGPFAQGGALDDEGGEVPSAPTRRGKTSGPSTGSSTRASRSRKPTRTSRSKKKP